MKTKELKEKESNVLNEELTAKRRQLFDLRTQAVTEKLEDPSRVGKTRREIAQILTVLRQRELEKNPKPSKAKKQQKQQPAKQAAAAK